MLYVVIILLTILVLFLFFRLFVLKREMRRIAAEMKENEDGRNMNVDLSDANLSEVVFQINSLYERILKTRVESRENEDAIRESISMISHDMRTPLTSIIGYLQIAMRSEEKEEVSANVEIALERARYLNRLINDFFEISLIESGSVSPTPEKLNLSEIICEEILAESPEIDQKGIEPSFDQADEDVFVMADRKMLTRIVQNLISNAVKYSTGQLDLVIEERDGQVLLRMISSTDEKIDTDRIFDRFYKEDSSRTGGGAGLGLYICKQLALQMGGDITASQEDGRFEIQLMLFSLRDGA